METITQEYSPYSEHYAWHVLAWRVEKEIKPRIEDVRQAKLAIFLLNAICEGEC